MTRIKGQLTEADRLHIEDYKKLVNGLHQDGYYVWEVFCRVAFSFALRCNEVQKLTWKNLLGLKEIQVYQSKTKKTREIPQNEFVCNKMIELYRLLGSPDVNLSVIANPDTSKPYTINWLNILLKKFRIAYQIDINRFSTHTFRKTYGRWRYDNATDKTDALVKLQKILGHKDPKITLAYLGITKEELNEEFKDIIF